MKSETAIYAYTGANPGGGRPAPDLSTVPVSTDSNFTFFFILAFARDVNRDGIFQPVWTDNITPQLIQQLQQENSNRVFMASLGGGDDFPWQAPSDENAWLNNAVSSLTNIRTQYNLAGFDIDYEGGVDDPSFLRVMSQLMPMLNGWPSPTPATPFPVDVIFTLAPYGATVQYYVPLFQNNTTFIRQVNYQVYADGIESQGAQGIDQKFAELAPGFSSDGSFIYLGLGICSTMQQPRGLTPRGLQPPDIYDAWDNLHGQGLRAAMIWCLEDSADNGFPIENAIQSRS
jgi:hypothetical protein